MSYRRVIPRALFNEANLLKCYGQIYMELERANYPDVELVFEAEGGLEPFVVEQDGADGSIYLSNVRLYVRGIPCSLRRPLNSRENYPLYLTTEDDEQVEVLNALGHFSFAMVAFLRGEQDED